MKSKLAFILGVMMMSMVLMAQPRRINNELTVAEIQNIKLEYIQQIRTAKKDTSYFAIITITDVNPVTVNTINPLGNKREINLLTEKDFITFKSSIDKAITTIDTKDKKGFSGGRYNEYTIETQFDATNNRFRAKLTRDPIGIYEGKFTYLYLEDLCKISSWLSTIDMEKSTLLPMRNPVIQTDLNSEAAKAPPIAKQYQQEVKAGSSGTNKEQLVKIVGKWYNQVLRNDYKNGGYESGSTGDYEPVRINEDGTWLYYGKRGKLSITPFTTADALKWKMTKEIPKWKLTFHDFSNGDGEGYFTVDPAGNPIHVVIKFKIYEPREGYCTWTQYRRS